MVRIKKKKYLLVKRVLDFNMAIILLILLLPIMIVIAILIKLESRGPVVFKQKRTGIFGFDFYIYKFRSMYYNNDMYDLNEVNKITKVGLFLRKTSLDELPQLINVLKGEMSFVGPRPWIKDYYDNFTRKQKRRLIINPGITGLAQIYRKEQQSIIKKIDYDLYYVENVSFLLDLKIIFLTIKTLFKKNNNEVTKATIMNEVNELKLNKKRLKE